MNQKQLLVNKTLLTNISEHDRTKALNEVKAIKALIQKRLREMIDLWWEALSSEMQQAADTHDSKKNCWKEHFDDLLNGRLKPTLLFLMS